MIDYANLVVSVLTMIGTIAAVLAALYLYRADQRPDIIAYLSHDRDNGCVIFVVENVGKGVARDLRIDFFDFGMIQEQFRDFVRERSFVSKGIPLLVPGENRSTIVLSEPEIKDYPSVKAEVELSYKRKGLVRPRTEKRSFSLDYYSFPGSIYTKSDLHKLRVAVEVIAGVRALDDAKND